MKTRLSIPRRASFTLIELLVVIAIIAVLASMLLPALSNARRKAKTVTCVGQYRQILPGFEYYKSDYDEYLPPATMAYCMTSANADTNVWAWSMVNAKYLPDAKIFYCTSLRGMPTKSDAVSISNYEYPNKDSAFYKPYLQSAYGTLTIAMAETMGGQVYGGSYKRELVKDIIKPAQKVLLGEGTSHSFIRMDNNPTGFWQNMAAPHDIGDPWSRLGSTNIMFADGHVQTVKRGANHGSPFTKDHFAPKTTL